MKQQNQEIYFNPLTGIRFFLALMVFIYHFNFFKYRPGFIYDFTGEFHISLTIFFVLSGFLISYKYADKVQLNRKWLTRYFINRFSRIYPIFFIFTILNIAYAIKLGHLSFNRETAWVVLLNLTLLKGLFDDIKFSGIAQAWSLTVEEIFYISAPLIFLFSTNLKRLFLLLVPITLIGFLLVYFFAGWPAFGFFKNMHYMWHFSYFGRAAEFFFGIALAHLMKNNSAFLLRFKHYTYTGLAGIIGCMLLMANLKGGIYEHGFFHPLGKLLNDVPLPFFTCCLFYGLIQEKTLLARLFSMDIIMLLGKSTYSFYMIHLGVLQSYLSYFIPGDNLFGYLFILFILWVLAILIYKFVEEPMHNYIRSLKVFHS